MQATQLRPTFTVELPMQVDDAMQVIRQEIGSPECYGRVVSAGHCVEFFVDDKDKRLWSPYLSVQAQQEEQRTVLFGRFSPRPEVWTFVMFLYAINSFLVIFGAMFGYGQWAIERTPWALACIPVGVVCIAAIHISSMIGQRLSADQMHRLRDCLDQVLQPLQTPRVGNE
jgi:hypothetical protein